MDMIRQSLHLLKPRWWSLSHGHGDSRRILRSTVFAAMGLGFWTGIYLVSRRLLTYFQKSEDIGDILAYKLLSIVLIACFSLLVFSAILTALSKLYLSKDLNLVHALPVPAETLFLARWIESTVDSAWMVVVFTLPVLAAYGTVYRPGLFFYADILLALVPLCLVASGISALIVLGVVLVLPASRIQSVVVFLGLSVFIVLYLAFRMARPERLVDPETFSTVLGYMEQLRTPSSPYLPSTWAFDSLKSALQNQWATSLFHAGIAWSCALFVLFLNLWAAKWAYFRGYSKTQGASIRLFRGQGTFLERALSFLPGTVKSFAVKEIKIFLRDQTQWSQVFLVGALIVIYLYNYSVLPLEKSPIQTVYLQNVLSFLNMALAGFVLVAVVARFAFPAVSMEGGSFWIVRSSPITLKSFLWIKFWIYLLPLLVLSETLIVATNLLLRVSPLMMGISVATIFCLTPAVIAMGIGMGAAFPDFASENPAQSVTSFGGMLFMMLSSVLIGVVVLLEAGPVYRLFMAGFKGKPVTFWLWSWSVAAFSGALALCFAAVVISMRFGEIRLKQENAYVPDVRTHKA
jgi:ABC-2 type transport system permease protein